MHGRFFGAQSAFFKEPGLTKRYLPAVCAIVVLGGSLAPVQAKVIDQLEQLTGIKSMTTVTFTEQRLDDNKTLGSLGQPFESMGLVLPDQAVAGSANLAGFSGGAAIRSRSISSVDNSNNQMLSFIYAQKAVGFSVFDNRATQIVVTALDRDGKELESITLPHADKPRYVGFVRPQEEITQVRISAPHASMDDAIASPTLVDDVTFAMPFSLETSSLLGSAYKSDDIEGGILGSHVGHDAMAFANNPPLDSVGGTGGGDTSSHTTGNPKKGAPNSPQLVVDPALPPELTTLTNTQVPEPAMAGLAGVIGIAILLRRRRIGAPGAHGVD